MRNKFCQNCIVFFILLLCSHVIFADQLLPFSNLYAFGDSLTDDGNTGDAPYTNKNTDGTFALWINNLGFNITKSNAGGNNYANAGALTGNLPFDLHSTIPNVINTDQQIALYLSMTGGKADPNALYTIWAGGNDLADAVFEQLSWSQIATVALASISNTVQNVETLHNAGAKYIIVPNIPDLSRSPEVIAYFIFDPDGLKKTAEAIKAYNMRLLSSLNATGVNPIQVDAYGLLTSVQNNFSKFGFIGADTTTCNMLTGVSCGENPNENIFFNDGFHPSQATHKIMGDYILSILEGPELTSYLARTPLSVMNTQNAQIQTELLSIESGAAKIPQGKWHLFTSGDYTHNDDTNSVANHGYHQDSIALLAGFDYRINPQAIFGFAVGRSTGTVRYNDASKSTSYNFDLDENIVNIFGGIQFWDNKAYINSSLGFGLIDDSNIHRSFMLGICPETVSGETTGNDVNLELNAGYNFKLRQMPHIQTGPIASLSFQHVNINPFSETSRNFEVQNTAFDALQYDNQSFDDLTGGLGWQIKYNGLWNDVPVMPYLQVTYNHPFIEDNVINAGVTSLPGSHFELPITTPYRDYGLLSTGIESTLDNGLTITLSYNLMGAAYYTSQNLMLGLSIPI